MTSPPRGRGSYRRSRRYPDWCEVPKRRSDIRDNNKRKAVWDADYLVLANIRSPGTLANL